MTLALNIVSLTKNPRIGNGHAIAHMHVKDNETKTEITIPISFHTETSDFNELEHEARVKLREIINRIDTALVSRM
jgi:hypothetical protein